MGIFTGGPDEVNGRFDVIGYRAGEALFTIGEDLPWECALARAEGFGQSASGVLAVPVPRRPERKRRQYSHVLRLSPRNFCRLSKNETPTRKRLASWLDVFFGELDNEAYEAVHGEALGHLMSKDADVPRLASEEDCLCWIELRLNSREMAEAWNAAMERLHANR